jgi:hypothetical protein
MSEISKKILNGMAKKHGITTKGQLIKYLVDHKLTEKQANDQLKIGYKIELEHTDNPEVAAIIAADHMVEFPNPPYYTALAKMEKELEAKKNNANIGKALIMATSHVISSSVARRSSNPIVKAIASGVSVGTAIGTVGALLEESKPKMISSTRQVISTEISPQTASAIEEIKELPKRERNVIASSVEGEAFIGFTYDQNGRPTIIPKDTNLVAFLDVDREYSDSFAAQSIRDKIGGNWKRLVKINIYGMIEDVPLWARDEYSEHGKPTDFKGEPKWFKRVKVINQRKKNKGKKQKANRAAVEPLYFQPIPHGILFNYENVKSRLQEEGLQIVDAKWKPETDKKIHEIRIITEPKNVNKMKRIEGTIDDNIRASGVEQSGRRSIIVQATESGDLLFIVEGGISRVYQEENEEIGI